MQGNRDGYILSLPCEVAIEEIMNIYGEDLKRLIYMYIKNWTHTDDIIQEVFLTIYLKLHTFKGESSLKTWVYRITINKCKDYLKSWQYVHLFVTDKIFNHETSNSVEEQLMKQDSYSDLKDKIMGLPVKYREVIILFYIREFSLLEIAELLQISIDTVKTRLRRARQKLHEQYSFEEGNEYVGK